jgi:hypothetical protein
MNDLKGAIHHLREHQEYPATKEELVAECDNLSDFSEKDRKWFANNLPDRTYNSANEVIKALKLNK